jgi:hypothetical protein
MRRSASSVLRDLGIRVAKLEKQSNDMTGYELCGAVAGTLGVSQSDVEEALETYLMEDPDFEVHHIGEVRFFVQWFTKGTKREVPSVSVKGTLMSDDGDKYKVTLVFELTRRGVRVR